MASNIDSKDQTTGVVHHNDVAHHNDDSIQEKGGLGAEDHHVEVLKNQDAYDGENREHAQTTWGAFKSHPWAAFWAFIMCFTIVSFHHGQL
jgi:SP family general alpha glucoside:H+ symporter-like MFS transporter